MSDALFLMKTIADLTSKVGSGITPKGGSNIYTRNGPKLIRSQNVHPGCLSLADAVCIPEEIHQSMNATRVEGGDVLLNITGASIGRCAIAPFDIGEANVNQHVCIIRSEPGEIDSSFLMHYLNSYGGQDQINRFQAGGNREGLNFAQIRSMEIPIPPLPEQKKIAEILSGIDGVINGYMKQLKHRRIFCGAFLDKEISLSKSGRNLVPLGEVIIQSKKKGIGDLPIYSVSVGQGMIRRDSLERSLISSLDKKDNLYASKGDFCYNMMRMWQGASGIAPEDCLISPAYVVCQPSNEVLPEYLAIACRSTALIDKFRSSSRGITSDRWRLYYEDFAKIEVPLPGKVEQSAIVARNKVLSGSTNKIEECIQKAIRLKESISSDLLSGRKRVSI